MVVVRMAIEADIPRILELYDELVITTAPKKFNRNSAADDYRKVFLQIAADPRHELLVAEEQGKVVGTVVLIIVPNLSHNASPWALMENMVVDSEYRRQGIGKLLTDYAVRRAKAERCFEIQLSSTNSRKEAHAFYRSMGFKAEAHGFRRYV